MVRAVCIWSIARIVLRLHFHSFKILLAHVSDDGVMCLHFLNISFLKIDPIGISLSRSLGAIVRRLSNLTETDRVNGLYGGLSQVVLVVAQSHRISQVTTFKHCPSESILTHQLKSDFASAKRMIEGSFQQFPDLYFVFLTNDGDTFRELVHDAQTIYDIKRQQEHYKIIELNSIDPSDFSLNLFRHLKLIPKRIMAPFCDTLTPEERRKLILLTNDQNW